MVLLNVQNDIYSINNKCDVYGSFMVYNQVERQTTFITEEQKTIPENNADIITVW